MIDAAQLIQYRASEGARKVGAVANADTVHPLAAVDSVYGLALRAIAEKKGLTELASELATSEPDDYGAIREDGRLLVPIDHPVDEAYCLVSGHKEPRDWTYIGDGSVLCASGATATLQGAAQDAQAVARLAFAFVVDGAGRPWQVGHTIANDFRALTRPDGSALQPVGLGPQLQLGESSPDLRGTRRLYRAGACVAEVPFDDLAPPDLATLVSKVSDYFGHRSVRRPGAVHVLLLGGNEAVAVSGDRKSTRLNSSHSSVSRMPSSA